MINNTSEKRQVILYGAFDRYNYGDNLMPILLEMYFKKEHPEKTSDIDFIFSSIMDSDLSHFSCKPSIAMTKLLSAKEGSTVIVVGGEVLGADIGTLFMHVQENLLISKVLRITRRFTPRIVTQIAKSRYKSVWDYPYIPNKKSFLNDIKVVYNTVGGHANNSQIDVLKSADYISVRDERTYQALPTIQNRKLVPDSVLMASKVVDINFISSQVRDKVKNIVGNKKFITVQACPYKVNFTEKELADELSNVVKSKGVNVVLLPIGYASGHDDIIFLEKVKSYANEKLLLLNDLT
ncbi:polysaccharide pyruvyl transferase family protein, partial [Gibbsiella quercinecans]|uniref:polysaccharide pyruvyl transferase family protein n=1 Tax=Gibbsiella quercinecans TaxID=929813 RepID=UPI0011C42A02